MNIEIIKNEIEKHINNNVLVKVYGMRNKNFSYNGVVTNVYPYIFTVLIDGNQKSFNYADVITGDIVLEYL